MEQSAFVTYNPDSNNTKHYYAGDKSKTKGNKMACKTKKKPGKK